MGKKRVIVFIIVAIVIAGLGVYHQSKEEEPLIEEESIDYEAPIIEELNWKPTRVVNDKVYDGALSFRARDVNSIIKEASVKFIPKAYTHLSTEAFSNESTREFLLEPFDGGFDENIEGFLVNISDIIGGREYEIHVTVKDDAGNIAESKLKTPYIREFENLGNLLYDNGFIIGVSYFLYSPKPHPWETGQEPSIVHPLMGRYDGRDQIVFAKHIDWATGHGINCFFLGWGEGDETDHKEYHENYVNFVSSPLINQIHISILYEGWRRLWFHGIEVDEYGFNLDKPEQWQGVMEDFKVLNNDFFQRENFLKINDKPVVFFYECGSLNGKVELFLDDIRNVTESGVFLFTDQAHINVLIQPDELGYYERFFDGFSMWAASWYIPVDEPRNETFSIAVEKGCKSWNNVAEKYEKPLMPSVIPGFVDLRDPNWVNEGRNLPRDVDMFSKELRIAIEYATPIDGKKLIRIDTWSDFGEGTVIEPTKEEGFAFLKAARNVLSAPLIYNFTCSPIVVKNDKVYSLNLLFEAEDIAVGSDLPGISKAQLQFIPVVYEHLSQEAFPDEPIRSYELTPIDGIYDEAKEEFTINITDIIGGREYEVKILLTDKDGNKKAESMMIPYIREFENLGKLLYDNGLVIGVTYFEYYPDPCPWEELGECSVHPLLGDYNVRDPVVIAKHIDWATGHGINCYFLAWGWDDEYSHNVYHKSLLNLVSSPMINQLHIAMDYDISRVWFHGILEDENAMFYLDNPEQWRGIIEDFKVLDSSFFNKDNFLKIEEKPVVYWYGGQMMFGNLREFLDEVSSTHNSGLYIFTDYAYPSDLHPGSDVLNRAVEFDGWGIWAAGWSWGWKHDEPQNETFPMALEKGYSFWSHLANEYDKVFIPSIIPGFVELRDPNWLAGGWNLPRDVGMFKNELKIALNYATQVEGKIIIKIDSWNDFGEGHAIEPTMEEGLAFLEAIRDVIEKIYQIE